MNYALAQNALILFICLGLIGCIPAVNDTTQAETTSAKEGESSLEGTIVGGDARAGLLLDDGEVVSLQSYSVDFAEYADEKRVIVTGEYSGTTLYVDEIQIVE